VCGTAQIVGVQQCEGQLSSNGSRSLIKLAVLAAVVGGGVWLWQTRPEEERAGLMKRLDPVLNVFALGSERGSSIDRRPPGAGGPPPAVTVSKPAAREVIDWDEYTGRFEAVGAVDVRARVAGYLEHVHFKDGQVVARGDLLYTVDRRPFEAAVGQARAELAQAQTKAENTLKDIERGRPLVDRKFMSEKVFDDRNNLRREAEAAVKVAEAKLRTAELDLSFTSITAPIAGRISRTLITAGNYVTGGGAAQPTLLTTIVTESPIYVYFDISEAAAIKYRRLMLSGAKGVASEAGGVVELALPDERGFPHRGTVDFSDNRLDASTGTLRVRAVVDNPRGLFKAGLFARVRVGGSAAYQALLLPDEAFGTDQAVKFVLVVAEDGTVARRVVQQGPLIEGLRVVRSGVKPDDWVVIKGLQRARPGQKVAPTREVLKVTEAAGTGPSRPIPAQ
jgi:RND family efflux transporter MFP subunit